MLRQALRIAVLTMAFWLPCVDGRAETQAASEEMPLPPGVKPFTGEIAVRYGGFERFTLIWRVDILVESRATIAEGWVMQGTMHESGEDLTWSYRLANIGRDAVEREAGRLEVTTNAWGEVRSARLLSRQWPKQPGGEKLMSDWLFEEQDLRFLACCCPRAALRMGEAVAISPESATMPHFPPIPADPPIPIEVKERDEQSVVAGVLDTDQGRQLVIRHRAHTVSDTQDGTLMSRRTGYSVIDTRTCLPVRAIWAHTMWMPSMPDQKPFTLLVRIETRQ